ncbi:MAG: flavin reductase [Anaerolineaceae bacterium]|nr:flavin reductase [Anaerolineaceae bacterium]
MRPIDPASFSIKPHDLFHTKTCLLTCGDFSTGNFNTMTIGWGSIGTMWSLPFTMVAVRPSRFTFEFMNKFNDFTVTAFPESCKSALNLLGTKSGRDGDKIGESGLIPIASNKILSPSFEQAVLSIECKKIYWQDLDHTHFLDQSIYKYYSNEDYHRIYFGKIVYISAE